MKKIKETIITEVDDRGRVTNRTRTVETYVSNTDQGYDYGTIFGGYNEPRRSSFNRIFEAYDDYCRSREW